MNPTPSLADRLHAWTFQKRSPNEKLVYDAGKFEAAKIDLRVALRTARRFRLDDDFVKIAVARAAEVRTPLGPLAMVDLANLPFPKLFVEYSGGMRVAAQVVAGTMGDNPKIDPVVETMMAGFLFERVHPDDGSLYRASYIVMDADPNEDPGLVVSPLSFVIDTQGLGRRPRIAGADGLMQDMIDVCGWGCPVAQKKAVDGTVSLFADEALKMRGGGAIERRFTPALNLPRDKLLSHVVNMAQETVGTLRFIASCWALVNSTPIRYIDAPKQGPQMVRGRNVPFLELQTITINAGRTKNLRRFVEHCFTAARRKRHSVRGFWRNVDYKHTVPCVHEAVERDGEYALCGRCQRLLRWIDCHERGDATLGYVMHDYRVAR